MLMTGKLFIPSNGPNSREILIRSGIVVALIIGVTVGVYLEGGLIDTQTGKAPGFWDCLYYALVTITTVGYGDIVPVGTSSRLIDAILLTPIRFFVLFLILGTAYQLAFQRFQEEYRMNKIVRKLKNHIIICGFGATGRVILDELLQEEHDKEQIVVLDMSPVALEEATEYGVICILGDATRELVLKNVAIDHAAYVLVSPGRDDTAALITLTARGMGPNAHIIAMCHETENIKLLERAGANRVINPALAGGSMMAAATRRRHLVETMQDLISFGGDLQLNERRVKPDEVGKAPTSIDGIAVVRIYRGSEHFSVAEFPKLEAGDVIVYLCRPETTV